MEIVAQGDRVTVTVNGTVVNEATRSSLTEGKILIQSEGAEIYFRLTGRGPPPTPAAGPCSILR